MDPCGRCYDLGYYLQAILSDTMCLWAPCRNCEEAVKEATSK